MGVLREKKRGSRVKTQHAHLPAMCAHKRDWQSSHASASSASSALIQIKIAVRGDRGPATRRALAAKCVHILRALSFNQQSRRTMRSGQGSGIEQDGEG